MDLIQIHDWKDSEYYDKLKNEKDVTRWAWEFLRRNPEYQKEYRLFASFPDDDGSGRCKNGKWRGSPWDAMKFYEDAFFYTNPPAYKGETLIHYKNRCSNGEYYIPYSQYLEEKYYIQPYPIDPAEDYSIIKYIYFSDITFNSVFDHEYPPWEMDIRPPNNIKNSGDKADVRDNYYWLNRMCAYSERDQLITIGFDLRYPIDEQVDQAKRILMATKERRSSSYFDQFGEDFPKLRRPSLKITKFPTYIRILDAIIAGATINEMGRFIYNEANSDTNNLRNKIEGNISSANRWRDHDYWKITV